MSMYLPNDDVEPTGEEAAEFIAEPTPEAPSDRLDEGGEDEASDEPSGGASPRAE